MEGYVLDLDRIDRTQVAMVGGKGAQLGELRRVDGVRVPDGFCVKTGAFRRVLDGAPLILERLEALSRVTIGDPAAIGALSSEIRGILEDAVIPDDVGSAIRGALARLGEEGAYAVRSSATAEDLPAASFAGQQDTYLNVVGAAAVLEHVRRCWASLFTDRAVTYRMRNGLDHRKVHMAVVVQRMVFPRVAGVLFTADPINGHRKVCSVEASFGLGEALVSGLVNADVYKVRDGAVVDRTIGTKQMAIEATPGGGTSHEAIGPERRVQAALTDAQAVELAGFGRRIEAHFGCPQDIEWCLADDGFQFVQTRPITTLFPIPDVGDGEPHVYVSVGHQQMMTDAMRPLGLSLWQLTARRPMYEAGGRLFVDVARNLAAPASRAAVLDLLGKGDPLIGDALRTIVDRGDFLRPMEDEAPGGPAVGAAPAAIETDAAIVAGLVARSEESIAAVAREIRRYTGPALLDFLLADIAEMQRIVFDPQSHQAIMAGMEAAWWLNERLEAWLGERNAADALAQSVAGNVTSEMGLALLEVADAIRPHAEVVAFLQQVKGESFLDDLLRLPGGQAARDAIVGYLDEYGSRCSGEIDITRPRWRERPSTLVPLIRSNVRNFEPGAGKRRFDEGLKAAQRKENEVLRRLRALPDGAGQADEAKKMIDRLRTFAGYREYPKYAIVQRYFVYKQALLEEAGRLVQAGVLRERDDIFYLTMHEVCDVVRTQQVDDSLIGRRREAFRLHQTLAPPRVLTSDGEIVTGTYRRGKVPDGALVGLPVSAGVVEGRARVVLDLAQADLEAGDVLVTRYTDPSWTPLFVAVQGLVTEVGGLMTHGAVIAREYGLPAVVGVEQATRLIRDGQRIRVDGTTGTVEVLP